MVSDPLRKAQKEYRKGKYAQVLAQLEPLSLTYRESHLFFFLMGTSCLFTGDIGGASTYLRRAEQLNFRHSPTQAALAAVHVRRGETDKAVRLYLDMLGRDPRDRFAKKSLDFLKSNADPDRLAALVKSGGIEALYPKPSWFRTGVARFGLPVLVLALAGSAAVAVLPRAALLLEKTRTARAGLEGFLLTEAERENPVVAAGGFEFILTEREAVSSFEKVKRLFSEWNDEAALVEINRLLLSNASPSLKEKAATLRQFIQDPDFSRMKQRYSFADVARSPRLFEGVGVIWQGQAGNVRDEEKGPTLDLLVGYQDRKKLEGIVPVRFSFPIRIPSGVPLEVLGRIRVEGSAFSIEGLAVHELREAAP